MGPGTALEEAQDCGALGLPPPTRCAVLVVSAKGPLGSCTVSGGQQDPVDVELGIISGRPRPGSPNLQTVQALGAQGSPAKPALCIFTGKGEGQARVPCCRHTLLPRPLPPELCPAQPPPPGTLSSVPLGWGHPIWKPSRALASRKFKSQPGQLQMVL